MTVNTGEKSSNSLLVTVLKCKRQNLKLQGHRDHFAVESVCRYTGYEFLLGLSTNIDYKSSFGMTGAHIHIRFY